MTDNKIMFKIGDKVRQVNELQVVWNVPNARHSIDSGSVFEITDIFKAELTGTLCLNAVSIKGPITYTGGPCESFERVN